MWQGQASSWVTSPQDLQMKNNYNNWRSYGRSKLANVLFTYELARQAVATNTTRRSAHL